jgi:hypothetical protein
MEALLVFQKYPVIEDLEVPNEDEEEQFESQVIKVKGVLCRVLGLKWI